MLVPETTQRTETGTKSSLQDLEIYDLVKQFGLEEREVEDLFPEWRTELPSLTSAECEALVELAADYRHLAQRKMLEPIVKMVVLGPLFKLAGFYREPFFLTAEKIVRVAAIDPDSGDRLVRGRLDLLVVAGDLWVTIVEAKRVQFSIEKALPQTLADMLSQDVPDPAYGFLGNGPDFAFLKLVRSGDRPRYARTKGFSIYSQEDLQWVLKLLKKLGRLALDLSIV